jgi:nonsense-mediated mRNA decay protein 3
MKILVKKTYPERSNSRTRHWELKQLDKEVGEEMKKNELKAAERDYEDFLREVEEDPEMRGQIRMYKTKNAKAIYESNKKEMGEEFPEIGLEELLDTMSLGGQSHKIEEDMEEDME